MTQRHLSILIEQIEDWLRRIASDEERHEFASELECGPDIDTIMTSLTILEAVGDEDKIRGVHAQFL